MEAQTVIARRIALELKDGMLVNLGIGIPTMVANYVPQGMHVFFQSENGLIGTGPIADGAMVQARLTDAGGRPVTAIPGACTFDSAISFGLIRGGHVDMITLHGRRRAQILVVRRMQFVRIFYEHAHFRVVGRATAKVG